ncbi:MAG: DUF3549 family protein [Gammaproteobacteria bacterium]|nr:DUF3549 family protein [Gammaproteobacteria bacterium]
MERISSLSDFFNKSQTHYHVYDMGRGVRKLDREPFQQFEAGTLPYPYPLQQHAWLGILGWNGQQQEEQFIWFLKFPLDETGCLIQATRDDFMGHMLETLGRNIEASRGGNALQDGMQESPYGFKPKEGTMAAFHAMATVALGQPPSRFYRHACDYLDGAPGYDQWAFVGLQGIADVAARLGQDNNLERVVKALPQLPPPALSALCGFLENTALPSPLAEALLTRLRQELDSEQTDISLGAALLRAFSRGKDKGLREAAVHAVLDSRHASDINLLAAIAARNWETLQEPSLARAFCEALAANNLGHEAFIQVMADLMFIPGMRPPLLAELRNPERSRTLSTAVGAMFNTPL